MNTINLNYKLQITYDTGILAGKSIVMCYPTLGHALLARDTQIRDFALIDMTPTEEVGVGWTLEGRYQVRVSLICEGE
jgi:hypothetical protein